MKLFLALLILLISFPAIVFAQDQEPPWQGTTSYDQNRKPYPILEIVFSYDVNRKVPLEITNMAKKQGFAPRIRKSSGYTLQLLNEKERIVSQTPLRLPVAIQAPPPINPDELPPDKIRDTMRFAVTVALAKDAVALRIVDSQGREVLEQPLGEVPEVTIKPSFRSLQAESLLRIMNKQSVKAAASPSDTLDIAFIGDNYTNMISFHRDVDRLASYFMTYDPYPEYADNITFHTVDNTEDLDCRYNDRLLICDDPKVEQVLNDKGVPHDQIVVVVKSSEYGGSGGGGMTATYNGEFSNQVFVHEFGHSFGDLWDEYNVEETNGKLDGKVYKNCYAGNPPSSVWGSRVKSSDYNRGCTYPNWYRSSEDSIMLNLTAEYYNRISQDLLRDQLKWYTTAPSPTPTLTPRPTATKTPTPSLTRTPTPSVSATPRTPTPADAVTPTGPTPSPTRVVTPTLTRTPTPTRAPTSIPSVTPTRIPTPTRTITPSPTVTTTPTPTITPTPLATSATIHVTLLLHGIGNAGDVQNPVGGNKNPEQRVRPFTLKLISADDQTLQEVEGIANYTDDGNFQGSVTLTSAPQDPVFVRIKSPGFQGEQTATPLTIAKGQTTTLPQLSLITGDINDDNSIDILDYNILLDCFSSIMPPRACTFTLLTASDLNDDGLVNEFDYNLFLRELSNRTEQ